VRDPTGVIILLGAPNDDSGQISSLAIERCEQAVLEYRTTPGHVILPTGGFGKHFNRTDRPHVFYTRRWLLGRGVPERNILAPVLSAYTREDARLSKPVVFSCGVHNVVVVTSDFHMARARLIFKAEFAGFQLSFSASKTVLPQEELVGLLEDERNALARIGTPQRLNKG